MNERKVAVRFITQCYADAILFFLLIRVHYVHSASRGHLSGFGPLLVPDVPLITVG